MAHFTIILPDNIHAQVYKGKVFKKQIGFTKAWPFIKRKGEERIGYVIRIYNGNEYHLVRTTQGIWNTAQENDVAPAIKKDGRWVPAEDDGVITAIKTAIDDYENK